MFLSQESIRSSIARCERRLLSSVVLVEIQGLDPTTNQKALYTGQPLGQGPALVDHIRVQRLIQMNHASIKGRFILSATGSDRMNWFEQRSE